VAEALEQFRAARRETMQFVDEFSDELRSWLTKHP
jgi:hypothetical protein